MHQPVDIIGQVDYLAGEDMPAIGTKSPKLVFSKLYSIIIHETNLSPVKFRMMSALFVTLLD